MTTVAERVRADIMAATEARDARQGHPGRAALEAMPIRELRQYVADCASDHGGQCVMLGQCYTSPAWRRFRLALEVLTDRGMR